MLYVTATSPTGIRCSSLLIAKTRTAPLKTETIPRLELCAAALLAQLLARVMSEYPGQVGAVFAWTDSSIVLAWLRSIPEVTWNHVSSQENPADVASRGTDPQTLHHLRLWWSGPEWLTQPMEMWPVSRPD